MVTFKRATRIISHVGFLHCPTCRRKHYYYIKAGDCYRCRKCGKLFKYKDYEHNCLLVYSLTVSEAAKIEKCLNNNRRSDND